MNFGDMSSPEECAKHAYRNGYVAFMFSPGYKSWGCRACAKNGDYGGMNSSWNVYSVAPPIFDLPEKEIPEVDAAGPNCLIHTWFCSDAIALYTSSALSAVMLLTQM